MDMRATSKFFALAFALSFSAAQAQNLTLSAPPTLRWGWDALDLFTGSGSCTGSSAPGSPSGVAYYLSTSPPNAGGAVPMLQSYPCNNGSFFAHNPGYLSWYGIPAGPISVYAFRGGVGGPQSYKSNTVTTTVYFAHEFSLPQVGASLTLSTTPGGSANCSSRSASVVDPAPGATGIPLPPASGSFAFIVLDQANCTFDAPGLQSQRSSNFNNSLALQFDRAQSNVWIYDNSVDPGIAPRWRQVAVDPATNMVLTWLSGDRNGIRAYVAVPHLQPLAPPVTPNADIWWAGASESGWGLSVGRNGEALFVAGFIYGYDGKPTWGVVQGGSWDWSHTVWTGDVYIPHGAPYDHYDVSKLAMGASAGKATLTFSDANTASFQYLGGYAHAIQRYDFAQSAANGPFHGYWWGGASQDGWGLHVAQQGDSVFATWYTYGADGSPTWFFMPGASKVSATHFNGALYRTTGGSWPTQQTYDSSATHVIPAGTLDLRFTSDSAGTMTAVVDGKTITVPIQRFGF